MFRINKWLFILGCLAFAGCALLDKISGHRRREHPVKRPPHSTKHHPTPRPKPPHPTPAPVTPTPTPVKPSPTPTAPGPQAARTPETVPNQEFERRKSELEARTKGEKQFAAFADGLRKINNAGSITSDRKQEIFSAIIGKARLTGKVRPQADALNDYYQSPDTSAADRQALDASLTSELSKIPEPP